MSGIAIQSVGTAVGEQEMSVSELVSFYKVSEKVVRRSLGRRRVRISSEPIVALAQRAVTACLERASVEPRDVSAILWAGAKDDGLHLQNELGAANASMFVWSGDCSDFPSALFMAKGLIADGYRRVLITSGERWRTRSIMMSNPDAVLPAQETELRDLFSDGGSAVLVSDEDGLEWRGFGSATMGRHWDYFTKYQWAAEGKIDKSELPSNLDLARDTVFVSKQAVGDCLRKAGRTLDQIDHLILPLQAGSLNDSYARLTLGIPASKVVQVETCSHVGFSDLVFGLESLLRSGRLSPGQHVLLLAKTVGIVRCALVRAGPRPPVGR